MLHPAAPAFEALPSPAPDRAALPLEFDPCAVLSMALRLRATGGTGRLAGLHLAMLRPLAAPVAQTPLGQAASGLGLRVSHVHPGEPPQPGAAKLRELARLLGQLYDAIDCHELPRDMVAALHSDGGVPVFDALDHETHAARLLGDLLALADAGAAPAAVRLSGRHDAARHARFDALVRAFAAVGGPAAAATGGAACIEWTDDGRTCLHGPHGSVPPAERDACHRLVLQAALVCALQRG